RPIRGFGPSRSWPPSWSPLRKRPRSRFGRWWPTASTAITPALPRRWVVRGWRSCWRSSRARASGHPMMRRTRRWRPPTSWAGVVRVGRGGGGGSSGGSVRGTAGPGGARGGWGRDGHHRRVVATPHPAPLPKSTTWYLLTTLHRPAARRAQQAQLAEIVATYGLRNWVEQGYKQVKDELGWADFQVRSDRAIRRH